MSKLTTIGAGDPQAAAMLAQFQQTSKLENSLKSGEVKTDAEVEKAATGFEALLLHQMMKSMWATVEETGMFGESSNQAQIYRDMLNQSIADSVAEGRGIGIKDFLKNELLNLQGASKPTGEK